MNVDLKRSAAFAMLLVLNLDPASESMAFPGLPLSVTANVPVSDLKPSGGDTGGGIGGTGYTVDDPREIPIVPLSGTARPPCPADQNAGRYRLTTNKSPALSSAEAALCLDTIFALSTDQQVELLLPNHHSITVEALKPNGDIRLQMRRITHPVWGDRLEIDIYARRGTAKVSLKSEVLEINAGFVGQVQVEGVQTFISVRKHRRD